MENAGYDHGQMTDWGSTGERQARGTPERPQAYSGAAARRHRVQGKEVVTRRDASRVIRSAS
jgi:hypothetical protein